MSLATSPEVQRLYWAEADTIAQSLLEHLRSCQSIRQMEVAGSYRRGQETIGDLDIVAEADEPNEAMDRLGALGDVAAVLGRGDTKMSVRLHSGLQVDLRIVPAKSFGAALLYFTGSKQHNIVLRGMAKDRGLRINEYGVFRVVGSKSDANADSASSAGEDLGPAGQYIAGRTEAEMYADARPAADSAGAARSTDGIRTRTGRGSAAVGRSRRYCRRSSHAHDRKRRQGRARGNGGRRTGQGVEIYCYHRSFAAGEHGQRAERRSVCAANGSRSTGSTRG